MPTSESAALEEREESKGTSQWTMCGSHDKSVIELFEEVRMKFKRGKRSHNPISKHRLQGA